MDKMFLYYRMDELPSLKRLKPQKRKDNKEIRNNETINYKVNKEGENNK